MSNIIVIDGSFLEGGGQIVRNALSLSCILRVPVRITNIRANRPNPGLSYQHLHIVNLLRDITKARVVGNELRSTTVEFEPGEIQATKNFLVDTRTAASVTLVYQAAIPVLLFGPTSTHLDVCGGTNVGMAPQIEFMTEVFGPNLQKFGILFDFELLQRGYYPRGGGRSVVSLSPISQLKSVDITNFGKMSDVTGWAFVAGRLPKSLAFDMQHTAEREMHRLWPKLESKIEVYREAPDMARDNGSGIILTGRTTGGCVIGASSLGEKRVDGHVLGSEVTREFCNYIKEEICVDCHVQDQLIIYMALANGVSRILTCSLTKHTRSAMYVVELLTGVKFKIDFTDNGHLIISCQGIGFCNPYKK